MTFRQFQSQFRPLVDRAWLAHCELVGTSANNRTAKDTWYREQLYSCCRIRSTKNISRDQQRYLISHFTQISKAGDLPRVDGWSDAQNFRFAELEESAWQQACRKVAPLDHQAWLNSILEASGVHGRRAEDRKDTFDKVMATLAVIAGDLYWIKRTAEAAEVRLRHQIRMSLRDLDHLTKSTHDWSYIQAIWKQARQLPKDINDAPAELLYKVLQMLDSHVRRLCKDYGIRPSELPSRSHPQKHPVEIREGNRHLHIGHELEHCPPVHVTQKGDATIPF